MTTNALAHPWRTPLAWSAAFRTGGLLVFGVLGWLSLFAAAGPAWRAVSLVAILALAAVGGITWYLSRDRAERRWRVALDRYAEREQAKRTHSRRRFHARSQSQAR